MPILIWWTVVGNTSMAQWRMEPTPLVRWIWGPPHSSYWFDILLEKNEDRQMTPMLPPVWIMVLVHLWVGLSLRIPQHASWELEGPSRLLPPFKGEHLERCGQADLHLFAPKGKPLRSHVIRWKYAVHLDTPTMIGWTIGGRVHQKSSARKVTHLSTISILGGSISKFPWDLG